MMGNMSRFHIRSARPDEAGLFYTPHPEEDKRRGTIGHIRMDFGRSGNEFWHTWWPRGPEELNSPAFKLELQEVVDTLRESVLKNRFAMERFCYEHGGKISGGWTQNYGYYMKFISYTNDGRVAIQHAALILSKLDETDTLELHTMDNAIILLKKDMTLVETRDVLQGMVRLARSMTLDALCNSDAEDKTPLVDESVDDEYEDTITIPVPLEAFGDAGLLGKDLHIQVIDGAVVITEDTDDE